MGGAWERASGAHADPTEVRGPRSEGRARDLREPIEADSSDPIASGRSGATSRLASVLRSIPDAVIAIDRQGRAIFVNPTAERILGRTDADTRGRVLRELLELRDASTGASIPLDAR